MGKARRAIIWGSGVGADAGRLALGARLRPIAIAVEWAICVFPRVCDCELANLSAGGASAAMEEAPLTVGA